MPCWASFNIIVTMETIVEVIPHRFKAEDLLRPEFRVPQVEPTLQTSQPCVAPANVLQTRPAEACTREIRKIEPVDSVQNSLDQEQPREDTTVRAESPQEDLEEQRAIQSLASLTQPSEPDATRNDEPETGLSAEEAPQIRDEQPPISSIQESREGGETSHRSLSNDKTSQAGPSQEGNVHESARQQEIGLGSIPTAPKAPQDPGNNDNYQTQSPVLSARAVSSSRGAFTKLIFWKRFKTSRAKDMSKQKATPQEAQASVTNDNAELTQAPSAPVRTAETKMASAVNQNSQSAMTRNEPIVAKQDALVTWSAHTITMPANSPSLYSVEEGVYVGKLRDLSPPTSLQSEWLAIRSRLIMDLHPILVSLPKSLSRDETIIELELCMSGCADPHSQKVQLRPSIWIRCGSKRCRKDIREAMKDISYTRMFTVHVRLQAPRFACNSIRCPPSLYPRATETPSSSRSASLNGGQIAGIVLGALSGLSLLMSLFLFFWRARRSNKRPLPAPTAPTFTPPVAIAATSTPPMLGVNNNPYGGPLYQSSKPPTFGMSPYQPAEYVSTPAFSPMPQPNASSPYSPRHEIASSQSIPAIPPGGGFSPFREMSAVQNTSRPQQDVMTIEPATPALSSVGAARQSSFPAQSQLPVSGTESRPIMSSCGIKITRSDALGYSRFTSTIGGIITVNGDDYGLTAAHLVSDIFEAGPHQGTMCADSLRQLSVDGLSSGSTPTSVEYVGFSDLALRLDKGDIAIQVTDLTGMDFALVRMGSEFRSNNTYRQTQRRRQTLTFNDDPIAKVDSELDSGPVSLLCSPYDIRTGFVLDGSTFFMDRTGLFETKKIYTEAPLEKGVSGAWVVRQDKLLGMIIAVYDDEPYAHMLPMHKVFSDIRSVIAMRADMDGDESKVEVSLPRSNPPFPTVDDLSTLQTMTHTLGTSPIANLGFDSDVEFDPPFPHSQSSTPRTY